MKLQMCQRHLRYKWELKKAQLLKQTELKSKMLVGTEVLALLFAMARILP